jgi:ribosomal-protein-alanine N-acetyltransferase
MDRLGTKELESERLFLRRFTMEDAPAMFANWAGDSEVNKFLTWPIHQSVKDSATILYNWVNRYDMEDCFYQWAIVLKDSGDEPIGSIGVVKKDEIVEMAEVGFYLGKKWWRQGLMSEALKMVINYLFSTGRFNRIQAQHDTRNSHSGQVMKKCGMCYEGTLREAYRNNQGLCDIAVYAILKKEFYTANGDNND